MTRTAVFLRNQQLDLAARFLAGGLLWIFAGPLPAEVEDATAAGALVSLTLPAPAFSPAVGGAAVAEYIAPQFATASGVAAWFCLATPDGGPVYLGDVSALGAGGALELESTTITAGDRVEVASLTLILPAS